MLDDGRAETPWLRSGDLKEPVTEPIKICIGILDKISS
jgi:hypothetical protein